MPDEYPVAHRERKVVGPGSQLERWQVGWVLGEEGTLGLEATRWPSANRTHGPEVSGYHPTQHIRWWLN